MYRKNAALIPTEPRNTPSGILKISTAEATALDLVGYPEQAAGLNNVATILAELGETLKIDRLIDVASLSPTSWLQRLGYLLNIVGELEKAEMIAGYIKEKGAVPTPLAPKISIKGSKIDSRWQVFVNTDAEPDV
jgi:predicted transcriptional regulator of viral defense system